MNTFKTDGSTMRTHWHSLLNVLETWLNSVGGQIACTHACAISTHKLLVKMKLKDDQIRKLI